MTSLSRACRLAALFGASALIAGCSGPAAPQGADRPTPVAAVRVGTGHGEAREFEATLRPRREVSLGFTQGGRVARLLVQPGDRVRKGQPLAVLSSEDQHAALRQALGAESAAVAEARRTADLAERGKGLDAQGPLSTAEVRGRDLMAEAAEGQASAASAAVAAARRQIAETTLIASEDGLVVATPLEPGMVVAAGAEVVRIAAGAIEAEVRVPNDLRPRAGETVAIAFGDEGAPASARVRMVEPALDPATGRRVVRLSLTPPPGVAINERATARFARPVSDGVMRVPLTALNMKAPGEATVWVISGGSSVSPVDVAVTGISGADGLVTGLTANAAIVASGPEAMRPGLSVRIVQMQEQH